MAKRNATRLIGMLGLALCLAACDTGNVAKPTAMALADPGPVNWPGALAVADAGKTLTDRDRALSARAEYEALQNGGPGTARDWTNPETGRSGAVTPGPIYSVNQFTCRDFSHRVSHDGRDDVVRATACRQPDGSWRPLG